MDMTMRDADEVLRAHDILAGVLLGEMRVDFEELQFIGMKASLDALCWVLDHEHNTAFARNLAAIEAAAEAAGFELRRKTP